jgi:hypothetical protein
MAAWDFYFAFAVGSNWSILGNQCVDPEAACVRVGGVDNLLCYGNIFKRSSTSRASGERSTITSHVGNYHWHAQNHILNQGNISVGPVYADDGLSGYAQRTDRCRWIVIERNLIDASAGNGAIQLSTGVEHVSIRCNVFTGGNTTHVSVFGYSTRYERGVDDVRIDSNTFYQTGGNAVAIKTQSTATSVRVRNNVMYAPNLAFPGCAVRADGGMAALPPTTAPSRSTATCGPRRCSRTARMVQRVPRQQRRHRLRHRGTSNRRWATISPSRSSSPARSTA